MAKKKKSVSRKVEIAALLSEGLERMIDSGFHYMPIMVKIEYVKVLNRAWEEYLKLT